MYTSLNRIDVELEPRDGRVRVVQTDHRDPEEITASRYLSVVFALSRCLIPLRTSEHLSVVYQCIAEPPDFLREAVKAAGAELWVGDDMSFFGQTTPVPRVDVATVGTLLNAAMHELAIAGGFSGSKPLDALLAAEHNFQVFGFPDPADEEGYWRAVVLLSAFVGEALRAPAGGAWEYNPKNPGTFPFTYRARFQGDRATINPLGKALKFIRRSDGDEQEPSILVKCILASP